MSALRAIWRLVGLVWQVLAGLWTLKRHFAHMTAPQRQQAVQDWAHGMLRRMGVTLVVHGQAPQGGPLLVVANHISWLDILVMNAACPARFVSKADVKHWPVLGTLVSASGTLFIERESRRDAMRVVHHMAERLQAGDVLAVFPEGTTSDGQGVLPFHANLLQAAIAAHAPIQPVALQYLDARSGAVSQAPSYVGDTSLLTSVWRTLTATGVQATVRYGRADAAQGRDRRTWSADLRADIVTMLHAMRDSGTPTPHNDNPSKE